MSTDRTPAVEQDVSSSAAASDASAADAGKNEATSTTEVVAANDAAPSAEAAAPATANDEAATRRRVQLNPTVDPNAVRPIPNLVRSEAAPAEATATPAPAAEVAAKAPAPKAAEEEPVAAAAAPEPPPPPVRRGPPVEIPRGEDLDAQIEAEIAAAMESNDIAPSAIVESPIGEEGAPAAEAADADDTLKSGTKLKGTIQSVSAENVFLDLGVRFTGMVPLKQFDPQKPPQVGDAITVSVGKVDESEGLVHCNLPRGRGSRVSGDWSAVAVGQVVECLVTKTNKGGLEVTLGNLRGFLPASQVEMGFVANLDSYVGQKLSAKVTEVNPARRKLIVSRRQLLSEERQAGEQKAFEELNAGQTMSGTVKTIKDYGAFIDLGGVDGFLHIGQISWQRIKHPSEVLAEGQSIEVKILSIDREKKRISLGLRQMAQNPWASAESRFAKGTTATGKVSRLEAFGAFVELEPGVEGLVHISEIDHKRVNRVADVLKVGQDVEVQILEVEPKRKRISLSVKALKAKPDDPKDVDPVMKEDAAAERKADRKPRTDLKGGIGGQRAGGLFGDPRQFS